MAVAQEATRQHLPVTLEAERRALDLLHEYVPYWAMRPRPRPIATEWKLGPSPVSPGDPFQLWRTARLDDISFYPEAGGALCLGEGKTTGSDLVDTVNQYTLHGQPMLQAALYKLAPQGEAKFGPIAGVMLDVAKKPYGKDKAKFTRELITIKPHALEWFIEEMRGILRLTAQIDWDTKVSRNISACTRMIGRARVPCPFRDLCANGRSAALKYVLPDGSALTQHQPVPGRSRMPWE